MTTYISIIRGINVSGQKKIKMDALKKMYEDLHFSNIQTYIQSGNVVFQYSKSGQKALENKISGQIEKCFGFFAPVIVMNTDELKDIVEKNPYIADKTKDIACLHVTFLSSKPEQIDFEKIDKNRLPGEECSLMGNAVYLYCPNGYGKTKLSNIFFENKLKVRTTTRNWKTTTELLNIAERQQVQDLIRL
jgi:uncharacterized protein (DUF1697 family)